MCIHNPTQVFDEKLDEKWQVPSTMDDQVWPPRRITRERVTRLIAGSGSSVASAPAPAPAPPTKAPTAAAVESAAAAAAAAQAEAAKLARWAQSSSTDLPRVKLGSKVRVLTLLGSVDASRFPPPPPLVLGGRMMACAVRCGADVCVLVSHPLPPLSRPRTRT